MFRPVSRFKLTKVFCFFFSKKDASFLHYNLLISLTSSLRRYIAREFTAKHRVGGVDRLQPILGLAIAAVCIRVQFLRELFIPRFEFIDGERPAELQVRQRLAHFRGHPAGCVASVAAHFPVGKQAQWIEQSFIIKYIAAE